MDIIIEDHVLYRDKKKWVKRLCKLARTNNFSDSVKLLVYTADDGKTKRGASKSAVSLLSKHVIYGHLHGVNMGSQSYVMYIVCKSTVECLAFEDFDTMKLWSDTLEQHLHDISQFVDLVYADKHSQLKVKLEGRLFFNCSHISFIRSPSSYEPKLLMSWKIADIMEYGCRNADKKNSDKGKQKNYFTDDSQSLFIMKVSPSCHRAPNTHIFACKDPRQFCSWMENLASNQENLLSSSGCEMMSQRLRIDSYTSFQRSRYDSESSPDCELSYDSHGFKNLRFFPDSSHNSRIPRFQRSTSEIRQYRCHTNLENRILEKKELEMNEQNVSMMCQSADSPKNSKSDEVDSPLRSVTLTCLERYPFEKERGRPPQSFRRQMSEGACMTGGYCGPVIHERVEFTLPRPKSSNNYCSLLNIRPKPDSAPSPSSPLSAILLSSADIQSVSSHSKDRDHHSPQYVNLTNMVGCQFHHPYVPQSAYANIEFSELIQEISDFCRTDSATSVQLQYADLSLNRTSLSAHSRSIVSCRRQSDSLRYIQVDIHNTMVLKNITEVHMCSIIPSLCYLSQSPLYFSASSDVHKQSPQNRCVCM